MFRNIFHGVNNGLKIVRNGFLIVAVFVTIFHLFGYYMNKDKLNLPPNTFELKRNKLYETINNPELQKNEFGKKQVALYRIMLCASIGETCTDKAEDGDIYYQQSLMGKATNLIIKPYGHPPASGIAWAYEGLSEAGFIPNTYAQGIGFYSLQPLAAIWKVFRNVAYLLIVLVIVSLGFLIMFRSSISAQTVISIENSLPRIVIALLLVTFSFAIAGFLIDLMYIIMALGGSVIIHNIAISGDPGDVEKVASLLGWQGDTFYQGGWDLMGKIVGNPNIWNTGPAFLSLVPYSLQLFLRYIVAGTAIFIFERFNPGFEKLRQGEVVKSIPFIGGILQLLIAEVWGNIVLALVASFLIPVILSIVVWVTCLSLFFRIFFMLLMTYTRILLSIIFSPIILLFEAFPGTSTFGSWFKGLFFNLLTFPIVAILIMTSGMIANVADINFYHNAGYYPVNGFWKPPFLYTIESDGFIMIVAISILFIIPDMIEFLKKQFGVEDLPFSVSPGTLLAGGSVLTGGAMGLVMRSRSIAREFGYTRDHPIFNTGILRRLKGLAPEDPYANFRDRSAQQTNPG